MASPAGSVGASASASASATPFNLGAYISEPFMRFIPKKCHPNEITLLNHVCNWVLLLLSFTHDSFSFPYSILALVACSIINYACTVLDCLDGMHARRSKQTSKLGEFLDHWLDAVHVPLVTGGISYCLRFTPAMIAASSVLTILIYGSESIDYHYNGKFTGTSGEEGQLAGSALFLFAILYQVYEGVWIEYVRTLLFVITVIISYSLAYNFVRKFDATMLRAFAIYTFTLCVVAALYLAQCMSTFCFVLIISMVSFRVSGCYILFSIIKKHYKGYSTTLSAWLFVLVCYHIVSFSEPVLIVDLINHALPPTSSLAHLSASIAHIFRDDADLTALLTSSFGEWVAKMLSATTVGDVLNYAFAIHVGLLNISLLNRNVKQLRKM